ncbi:MAG TPA: M48 family metallopeptidase [Longimicrobiaceae bacterium]|nr:M48 family metallopeptidase [Longimicrobiaceae bacterium]
MLALSGAGLAAGCAPQISTSQEVALGADYSRQINQQLPLIRDAATQQYINELGRSIARNADPRGIQYNFYVVNSDVVNAFAVPGGHIYVNRGLVERASNLSELAGVLAHEIGHVAERHSIEQLQRAQNANTALSVVYGVLLGRPPSGLEQAGIQVGGSAVFASYGRNTEREADDVAIGYLVRSGISPNGMPAFFEKLMGLQQRQPSAVEQWFSTHPLTTERIQNTRAAIQATPGANNASLANDSQAFQRFRQRVTALQPQPTDRRR